MGVPERMKDEILFWHVRTIKRYLATVTWENDDSAVVLSLATRSSRAGHINEGYKSGGRARFCIISLKKPKLSVRASETSPFVLREMFFARKFEHCTPNRKNSSFPCFKLTRFSSFLWACF